ncbi:MAG: GAF domain-containing protein [Bacteroidetes bacterium]|nr:GAF domain-containing protein [Bacteroidota bacterium]
MDANVVQPEFDALDAVASNILVLDRLGRIIYATKKLTPLAPANNKYTNIFEVLEDMRLKDGLREHIRMSGDKAYFFTAIMQGSPFHFQVTRWRSYYVCTGQSEPEIEQLYHQQIDSRRRMLEIKEKLLWLSMMDREHFEGALVRILQTACSVLGCERVSYWLVDEDKQRITCAKLYLASMQGIDESNTLREITKEQVPQYFSYIENEHAFILADDIEAHPATAEFTMPYSRLLNIKSLLDVPVWHNGILHGIVCCEQVGQYKKWSLDDVRFALAIADNVSLCLQTRDRIEAERKLKETNHKLFRSNTDLEHFASVAAHDMKSPLRSIVGNLQLLKRQHAEALSEDAHSFIDYSVKNATHLTQLINDLLSYSKLDQQIGFAQPVNIQEVLDNICADQREYVKQRRGTIRVGEGMPTLSLNYNMIYRLFANIMHNAIKYSSDGLDPVLEVSYKYDDNFHYFEFADNGIGVDDEYAEKIFSLFGRLHGLEKFDGTGIGLATCKKIAELFDGKIIYKRRQNPIGSVFTVVLPLQHSYAEVSA